MRNGKQINPGIYSCGHQGSETFINFINPHYPGHDNVAGTCHFRVLPSSPQICQVNFLRNHSTIAWLRVNIHNKWNRSIRMLIIFQVRIDFVDTEMLTPTEGSCKDQYMSISGGCQGMSKKPCTSHNLNIIILHQQIYMFFIIFQDRYGQLDLAASVVLILINIFTYTFEKKKILSI